MCARALRRKDSKPLRFRPRTLEQKRRLSLAMKRILGVKFRSMRVRLPLKLRARHRLPPRDHVLLANRSQCEYRQNSLASLHRRSHVFSRSSRRRRAYSRAIPPSRSQCRFRFRLLGLHRRNRA